MNTFQVDAFNRIRPILLAKEIPFDFKIEGVRENYFHLSYGPKDIEIWIYDDEIAFRLKARHLQCEKQDFDGPEDMLQFFIGELLGEL